MREKGNIIEKHIVLLWRKIKIGNANPHFTQCNCKVFVDNETARKKRSKWYVSAVWFWLMLWSWKNSTHIIHTYEKQTIHNFAIVISKSNMSFCDCNKRVRVDKSAWLLWNVMVSMQTCSAVLANKQNSVEKVSLVMILFCTHMVWQNLCPSSPASSSSKHHFSEFFLQLLN